jgi:hypothetical protein
MEYTKSLSERKTKNCITQLAGSSNSKQHPSRTQQTWLKKQTKLILEDKKHTEKHCAEYDLYVQDNNLDIEQIKNPYFSNRLNEFERSIFSNLTLGSGGGGGPDTREGYEIKHANYNGLNQRTNKLNQITFWFNTVKYETWEQQKEYLTDHLDSITGLKIAIRCPNGEYLNLKSDMDLATSDILMQNAKQRYDAIGRGILDSKMRTTINTTELLSIENFKLEKGNNLTIAKKYLGETYHDVI